MRKEINSQERRWRLITGTPTTGDLDTKNFYVDVLQSLFIKNEIIELCLDMNLDYENMIGDRKKDKARYLVNYCVRHGRSEELYERIKLARPKLFGEEYKSREP